MSVAPDAHEQRRRSDKTCATLQQLNPPRKGSLLGIDYNDRSDSRTLEIRRAQCQLDLYSSATRRPVT